MQNAKLLKDVCLGRDAQVTQEGVKHLVIKEGSQVPRVLTKILAKYPAIQISPEIMEVALANKSNADQVVDSLMNYEDQSFEVTKSMM